MIGTMTREKYMTLTKFGKVWFNWQVNFFGKGVDNTFEFKYIGPFVVGGAYWLKDEEGKRYLSNPREVASSTWGIGYPDESPPHLS